MVRMAEIGEIWQNSEIGENFGGILEICENISGIAEMATLGRKPPLLHHSQVKLKGRGDVVGEIICRHDTQFPCHAAPYHDANFHDA